MWLSLAWLPLYPLIGADESENTIELWYPYRSYSRNQSQMLPTLDVLKIVKETSDEFILVHNVYTIIKQLSDGICYNTLIGVK